MKINRKDSPCQPGALWYARPDGMLGSCNQSFGPNAYFSRFLTPGCLKQQSRHKLPVKRKRGKPTIFADRTNFTLMIPMTYGPNVYCRNLPISLLPRAKGLIARFEESCSRQRSGQKDFPSSEQLLDYHSTHPDSKLSLYVVCGESRNKAIRSCPENTYFDGNECVAYGDCEGRAGERWANLNFPERYFECDKYMKVVSRTCPEGMVFDGFSCVALHRDGCAGEPDGTKVAHSSTEYRECRNGCASQEVFACESTRPLFRDGRCVSPLCVNSTKGLVGNRRYVCLNGEPVVITDPYVQMRFSMKTFAAYLTWAYGPSASNARSAGLLPLQWCPLWPPWVSEGDTFQQAVQQNGNQMTLWRLNSVSNITPFTYSVVRQETSGTFTFLQTSRTQIVLRVPTPGRAVVPFEPCDIVSTGGAVGWTTSVHPALPVAMGHFGQSSLLLGTERAAVRVVQQTLRLEALCTEEEVLVDSTKPRCARVGTLFSILHHFDALALASPKRTWNTYFPVGGSDSSGDYVSIVNSSATAVFNIKPSETVTGTFRSVGEKDVFRTFAYSPQQQAVVRDESNKEASSAKKVVTILRTGARPALQRTENVLGQGTSHAHNFLPVDVADIRCRNSFSFIGAHFVSLNTTSAACLCDKGGRVVAELEIESHGGLMSFPFAAYELSETETKIFTTSQGTRIRVCEKREVSKFRLSAFGFYNTNTKLPESSFLPLGTAELRTLPKEHWIELPHIPLRIFISNEDRVTLAFVDSLSSQVSESLRRKCVLEGNIWDYENDTCVDIAESEHLLLTEDLSASLFAI